MRVTHWSNQSQYSVLGGLTVVFLADVESLRIGARKDGGLLQFRTLGQQIRKCARRAMLAAVIKSNYGSERLRRSLICCGYHVVLAGDTLGKVENAADRAFCFEAGRLVCDGGFDALVVGSGDANIALPVAEGIRRIRPNIKVLTLSFPSFTHAEIADAKYQHLFDGHIWAGGEVTTQVEMRDVVTHRKLQHLASDRHNKQGHFRKIG